MGARYCCCCCPHHRYATIPTREGANKRREASFFGTADDNDDDGEQFLVALPQDQRGGGEKYKTTDTVVTMASTIDTERMARGGGLVSVTSEEEVTTDNGEGAEEDEERSMEDGDYYLKYRPISSGDGAEDDDGASLGSNSTERALQNLSATRRQYEIAINRINGCNESKRLLIYEYEEFKSQYYNMEHRLTGEAFLTRARRCVNMEQKKMLYYEAILHTYDLEKKADIKAEYNAFFRGLTASYYK